MYFFFEEIASLVHTCAAQAATGGTYGKLLHAVTNEPVADGVVEAVSINLILSFYFLRCVLSFCLVICVISYIVFKSDDLLQFVLSLSYVPVFRHLCFVLVVDCSNSIIM